MEMPETFVEYNEPMLHESFKNISHLKLSKLHQGNVKNQKVSAALSQEILDLLVPPRTWTDENGVWRQDASMKSANRKTVMEMQELLEVELVQKHARSKPICRIREKLHSQVLDELLRQIALQCPERALVLLRLRDEQRMTMEVYQTLYHESLGFGQSQAVQVEKRIQPAQDKVDTLKMQIKGLKERIRIKQEEIEFEQYKCDEKHKMETKQRSAQRTVLKNQVEQLEHFFKGRKLEVMQGVRRRSISMYQPHTSTES